MVLNNFRDSAKKLIDGPVDFFVRHNFKPNMLSFIGLSLSIACSIFLAFNFLHLPLYITWPPAFLLFLSGAFDVFDGGVARKTNSVSQYGAFLDSILDRISDAVIFIGLIYGIYITMEEGFICFFLSLMISYARSRAENEGVEMKGVGFMERAERLLFLWVALILETWNFFFFGQNLFFRLAIWFFIGLLVWTFLTRIFFAVKNLKPNSHISTASSEDTSKEK